MQIFFNYLLNEKECEKESTIIKIFAQTKLCKQYVKLIPNYDAYFTKQTTKEMKYKSERKTNRKEMLEFREKPSVEQHKLLDPNLSKSKIVPVEN